MEVLCPASDDDGEVAPEELFDLTLLFFLSSLEKSFMSICLLFRIKLYRYSGYSAPPFEALWLDIGAGMCVSAARLSFCL